MDDLITLIAQTYQQDGIGQQIAVETKRQVWAHIRSAGGSEFMEGGRIGIRPELVAVTPTVNYQGEKIVEIGGKHYSVFRVYMQEESDALELHLQEEVGV